MNEIEARIKSLSAIRSDLTARPDYTEFWERTLAWNAAQAWGGERSEQMTPMRHIKVYKVTYDGYADTPIHGWFLVPAITGEAKYPVIVMFHGYTSSKGLPENYAAWLLMGYAVFAVDIRGQGGETGNKLSQDFGMTRGWITQGILDKDTCYYKAVAIDSLRAIDWASSQPEADPERVFVFGSSQGGGIVLLLSAWHDRIRAVVADVPNMCRMDYGILHSNSSLSEAAELLNKHPDRLQDVLATLSYFDIVNAADRIRSPVLVTVGLKDPICLPEATFAAFNRIASTEKQLQVYPFCGHFLAEGHIRKVQAFLQPYAALTQDSIAQ